MDPPPIMGQSAAQRLGQKFFCRRFRLILGGFWMCRWGLANPPPLEVTCGCLIKEAVWIWAQEIVHAPRWGFPSDSLLSARAQAQSPRSGFQTRAALLPTRGEPAGVRVGLARPPLPAPTAATRPAGPALQHTQAWRPPGLASPSLPGSRPGFSIARRRICRIAVVKRTQVRLVIEGVPIGQL